MKRRPVTAGPLILQVPKVFWQYSSPEILVLEYCPGIKINDAAALDAKGLDRQRLARLAVESYLQQILNHGFFHAGKGRLRCLQHTLCCGQHVLLFQIGLIGVMPDCSYVIKHSYVQVIVVQLSQGGGATPGLHEFGGEKVAVLPSRGIVSCKYSSGSLWQCVTACFANFIQRNYCTARSNPVYIMLSTIHHSSVVSAHKTISSCPSCRSPPWQRCS